MDSLGIATADWLKIIAALFTAIVAAALAAWFTSKRYSRERADEQNTLLNALFGELAHVLEHYSYASAELPGNSSDLRELQKRIAWSEFGELRATSQINRYGFLDADEIRQLLQLGLRIRNTDVHLELLRSDYSAITDSELAHVRQRMNYAKGTAAVLLAALVKERPVLRGTFESLRKKLPV